MILDGTTQRDKQPRAVRRANADRIEQSISANQYAAKGI